jgi:transposase
MFPEDVKAPVQYGPRIQAAAVYLSTAQFIPEDRLQNTLQDLFGLAPSPATLATIKIKKAAQLEPIMKQIQAVIASAPVKHLDETGFRIAGRTSWMHVSSTKTCTHYRADVKRGSLPEGMQGVVTHDHWKAYYKLTNVQHALCNAHHLRELKALIEIEREPWASSMARWLRWMAKFSRRFKMCDHKIPEFFLKRISDRYDGLIKEGLAFHEAQTPLNSSVEKKKRGRKKRRIGHNLLIRLRDYKEDTLRFLWNPCVSFTNNLAERDLRMVKIKQKISGGFRTMKGAEDFAILRGFLSSARKQNLNLLAALSNPQLLTT